MVWTDGRIDELKLLISQGLSAGKIAAQMGFTRNKVLGKAHRLKLEFFTKKKPKAEKPKSEMVNVAVAPSARLPNKTLDFAPLPPPVRAPRRIEAIPQLSPGEPVHILDLQSHHCRAVLGARGADDLAMFCGAHKARGYSYCVDHAQLFIQPPKETSRG